MATRRKRTIQTLGAKRWLILVGLFLVVFLANGVVGSLSVIIGDLTTQFEVSTAYIGALLGIAFGLSYWLAFVNTPLLRRFPVRYLIMLGGAVSSSGLIISSFALTSSQLTAGLVLYGLGLVFVTMPSDTSSCDYFVKSFEVATGFIVSGGSVGVLLPLVFEPLVEFFGWRGAVLLLGAINAHLVMIGALLEPVSRGSKEDVDETSHQTNALNMEPSDGTFPVSARVTEDNEELDRYEDDLCGNTSVEIEMRGHEESSEVQKREGEIENSTKDEIGFDCRRRGIQSEGTESAKLPVSNEKNGTMNKLSEPIATGNGCMNNKDVCTTEAPSCHPFKVLKALARLFDVGIFKDHPIFIIVCLQSLMFGISFSGWQLFAIPNALAKGLSTKRAVQVNIVGGVFSSIGRFAIGVLSSKEYIRLELWAIIIYVLSSAAFWMNYIAVSFESLMVLAGVTGLMIGAKTTMQLFLLTKRVIGTKRYKVGVSVQYVCLGITVPLTGALFGAIYDRTESYDISFCVVGAFDLVAALLLAAPLCCSLLKRQNTDGDTTFKPDADENYSTRHMNSQGKQDD